MLCTATSVECSRQDHFNDMAEHWSILKNDQNRHYSFIFQDRPMLCSATSVGCSRRDHFSDMAEHWSTLKNNQNRYYSFIFQI